MEIDNLIIIKGGSYDDIKKALRQWIVLYSDDLGTDVIFELYKNGRGNHIILADNSLDNVRFNYLVNYLFYPEDIEYKIDIEGFTTAHDLETYPKEILNKKIQICISDKDKAADNVIVVSEDGQTFKIDFGGKVTKINDFKTFRYPIIDFKQLPNPEIIKLNIKDVAQKRQESSKGAIKKRFKVISSIALGLILISNLIIYIDIQVFFKITFFLGLGLGTWFFSDYKMLQIDRYYTYSFIISLVYFGYGYILKSQYSYLVDFNDLGSLFPISILIVQKPLRFIFKQILNREPVIEKPIPTFWDGVYTLILFFSFALLPLIIIK